MHIMCIERKYVTNRGLVSSTEEIFYWYYKNLTGFFLRITFVGKETLYLVPSVVLPGVGDKSQVTRGILVKRRGIKDCITYLVRRGELNSDINVSKFAKPREQEEIGSGQSNVYSDSIKLSNFFMVQNALYMS